MRIEDVRSAGRDHQPQSAPDLILQLTRRPAHVPGIHAKYMGWRARSHQLSEQCLAGDHPDIAENRRSVFRLEMRPVQRANSQRQRAPGVQLHLRAFHVRVDFRQRNIQGTIQHQPQGRLPVMAHDQDHAPCEVWVVRFRAGEQQFTGRKILRGCQSGRKRNRGQRGFHLRTGEATNRYPTPRTVSTWRGLLGSSSI